VEHPEPPVFLADPQAGLVRFQSGSRQQTGADQVGLRGEGFARRVEHVDQRAFADVEAQQIGQEPRQPLESDVLGKAQIDNEGAQVRAERRSRRQVHRRRRLEPFAAARADAAMQRHPRDIGFDVGDFDVVIGFAGLLRPLRNVGAAALA
jgi:hypothetical protein